MDGWREGRDHSSRGKGSGGGGGAMPFTRWRKESLSVMMARGEKKGEEEEEVLLRRLLPLPAFFLSPFPKWLSDYCGSNSKGEREREASALTHLHHHLLVLLVVLLQPGGGEESPGQRSPGIGGGAPGRAGGDWARADGRTELEGNACVHEIEGTLSLYPRQNFWLHLLSLRAQGRVHSLHSLLLPHFHFSLTEGREERLR